jgi:hypothetical protein
VGQQKWQTPNLILIHNQGDNNTPLLAKNQGKTQLIRILSETVLRKYRKQYNKK